MLHATDVTAPTDLLRIADLTRSQLEQILHLASQMKVRPQKWFKALRGQSLVCFFEKAATRTRISFAVAAYRLGMLPIILSPEVLQVGRREELADTAKALSSYASAIVVRTLAQATLDQLAEAAQVPVINGLSNEHHPCQALADLLTLRERFGRLQGLRLAYFGMGTNIAHSLIEAGALAGMRITIAVPSGYQPDRTIELIAARRAAENGGAINVVTDPFAAIVEADAVYTDVWSLQASKGDQAQRPPDLTPYTINAALLARARPHAVFMHSLPAHRGEEVTADVIDGPASVVWTQSANRMPAEQAAIYLLISGRWDDRNEEERMLA